MRACSKVQLHALYRPSSLIYPIRRWNTHTMLEEIQEEAQTLKKDLDEFGGEQSEIVEIQEELVQVLIQVIDLEAAIESFRA